jgi:hypothetical protein
VCASLAARMTLGRSIDGYVLTVKMATFLSCPPDNASAHSKRRPSVRSCSKRGAVPLPRPTRPGRRPYSWPPPRASPAHPAASCPPLRSPPPHPAGLPFFNIHPKISGWPACTGRPAAMTTAAARKTTAAVSRFCLINGSCGGHARGTCGVRLDSQQASFLLANGTGSR